MKGRQGDAGRWLIESADASQMALGQRQSVEQTGSYGTTMPARSRSTSTFWPVRRREFPAAKARLVMVSFDFAARSSYLARRSSLSSRKCALPPGGQSLRNAALDSAIGEMRVEAAFAAIHAIEGHHLNPMESGKTDPPEWPRIDFLAPGRGTTSWEAQQAAIGRVASSLHVVDRTTSQRDEA